MDDRVTNSVMPHWPGRRWYVWWHRRKSIHRICEKSIPHRTTLCIFSSEPSGWTSGGSGCWGSAGHRRPKNRGEWGQGSPAVEAGFRRQRSVAWTLLARGGGLICGGPVIGRGSLDPSLLAPAAVEGGGVRGGGGGERQGLLAAKWIDSTRICGK